MRKRIVYLSVFCMPVFTQSEFKDIAKTTTALNKALTTGLIKNLLDKVVLIWSSIKPKCR